MVIEYKVVYDYLRHSGGGIRIFNFKDKNNCESFTKYLNDRIKALIATTNESQDTRWDVNSHNLTLVDDVWLVTILLQRHST